MSSKLEKLAKMAESGASSRVVETTGKGGLKMYRLQHGSGDVAEVYPHGATVTRYASGGREVLWVSDSAVFDGVKAIRGGIPVVFPMFGPKPDARVGSADGAMKQHGFARTAAWTVAETTVNEAGACRVVLTLQDSEATRAVWPFSFLLRYEVVLDEESLYTELKISNLGDAAMAPQCLLHTYLAVEDSKRVMIHGLEGATYTDKVPGADPTKVIEEDMPAVVFKGETDRIYSGTSRELQPLTLRPEGYRVDAYSALLDADGAIDADVPPDVVVWNPYINKAKAMGDFDDMGWTAMACVEPGLVCLDRPEIAPGGAVVFSQTLSAEAV